MPRAPLPLILSTNKTTTTSTPSAPFVAVFAGATTGIGSYALLALSQVTTNLRVYLIARNASKAQEIIQKCQALCPLGKFIFVEVEDLALLKHVDGACDEILRQEKENSADGKGKVDFLVMTQAYFAFLDRWETKEGLDTLFSLMYYSRMRLIHNLLPLLLASERSGGARVVSVFGPHRNSKLYSDDLSLRNPTHYGFNNVCSHIAYFTTFFFEELAKRYEGKLSLSHYFPSLVYTETFGSDERLPFWFKVLFPVLRPLVKLVSVPREESGQRIVYHLSDVFPARGINGAEPMSGEDTNVTAMSSDGVLGGGAYRTNWDAETMPCRAEYQQLRKDGMSTKVWAHTMSAFEEIEKGNVFTG